MRRVPSRRSDSRPAFFSAVTCWLTAVLVMSNAAAICPAASSSPATSRKIARRRGSAIARSATPAFCSPSAAGCRGRPVTPLSSAPQPDLVAVRVGEDGGPAEAAGQVGRRDQPLAAQLLGAVEARVEVLNPHVDLHSRIARAGGRADAPSDRAVTRAGVDQAPPAHGRLWGDLPAERLPVELLCPLVIGADHLEERHWLAHDPSLGDSVSKY